MQDLLVTATLKAVSGFAEDDVVNTFAIQAPDVWAPSLDLLDVTGPINRFYQQPVHLGLRVADFIGPSISRAANGLEFRVYDLTGALDGSAHGSPIAEDFSTILAVPAALELPREVAFAITLRGGLWEDAPVERPDGSDPGTAVDRPRQRRTGRIYLGPIGENADVAGASGINRPETSFMETCRKAVQDMQTQLNAAGCELCVWSRTDQVLTPVNAVQTDDAWDTQRRRGAGPTARTTLAV